MSMIIPHRIKEQKCFEYFVIKHPKAPGELDLNGESLKRWIMTTLEEPKCCVVVRWPVITRV